MRFFRRVLLSCTFSVLSCMPVFASTATASDAIYDEVLEEIYEEDMPPDIDYEQFFFDLYASLADGSSDTVDEEMEVDEEIIYEADSDMLDMPMLLSTSTSPDLPDVNCVWYRVLIRGEEYDVYFPSEYADCLWVSDSGYLYNVGAKDIKGRIFYGDAVSYGELYPELQLNSILTTSITSIQHNGSYNLLTTFEPYNGIYRGRSSYVHVKVLDIARFYQTSEFFSHIFLFVLTGGVLLLWLRSYKRY